MNEPSSTVAEVDDPLAAALALLVERAAERAAVLVLAELADREASQAASSPYMTIPEAAAYLRCSRQRIDDLLSQRRLTRHKDGRRTLVSRAEVERHVEARR